MTLPAFASFADQQSATATVVVSKPATGTATDVFVAHWSVAGNVADANMTLPAGWVQVGYLSPTGGPTVKLAYKVAVAGGEPSNYTFTLLSGAANQTCNITRYSNIDTSQLSDAYVPITLNSGTSGTNLTALDIVPESDNALLIIALANNLSTDAITIPSGFTPAVTHTTLIRNTVAYKLQATAGHSTDQIATQAASAGWTAILWAMRPLDLGTTITITTGTVRTQPSKLELTITLTQNDILFGNATFKANAKVSLAGMSTRFATFLGGFGIRDPMYNWDGTGAVPTVGEVRGGVKVFDVAGGSQQWITLVNSIGAGVPLDWIVWRLPWQFTENPTTLVPSTQADYDTASGNESRRIRTNRRADFQTYMQRYCAYLIARGARRFKTCSEWKGLRLNSTTWDYALAYDFYTLCVNGILLGAADAGVLSTDIEISPPYTLINFEGVVNSKSVKTDTWDTLTTPVETMRYKDDHVPAQWNMNNPPWGYPLSAPLRAITELYKLCVNNNTRADFFGLDFGMWGADGVIKRADDFANAEEQTRDMVRWARRTLQDVGDGRFATTPIDIAEYYIKPEGTIAQTTNTDAATGLPIPGPFLPNNQLRPYFAALKAVGLAVCVEEGVRTPSWWNFDNEAQGRTTPAVTGGSGLDQQAWYGEAVIHNGAIADGEVGVTEGTITAVGLVYKMFVQHFAAGTSIRSVTVSDSTKVYALPNLSTCIVVNKTAARRKVSINGQTAVTLAPYDTQDITFSVAFSGTAAATLPSLTLAATGAFTSPAFSGIATPILPSLTLAATGARTTPVYSGIGVLMLSSMTLAASGVFNTPAYMGTVAATLPMIEVDNESDFVPPSFTGSAALTLPSATLGATGVYNVVAYTGSVNLTLPSLTLAATGNHVIPEYDGTVDITLPAFVTDLDGDYIPPSVSGSASLTLSIIVVTAAGRVTVTDLEELLFVEASVEAFFMRAAETSVTTFAEAEVETYFVRSAISAL